jgi:hypothetical protein
VLPSYLAEELHGIRSIGNAGAHTEIDPANNETIDVAPGEAAACLDIIEELVKHLYVEPYLTKQRKAEREKKFGLDTK